MVVLFHEFETVQLERQFFRIVFVENMSAAA